MAKDSSNNKKNGSQSKSKSSSKSHSAPAPIKSDRFSVNKKEPQAKIGGRVTKKEGGV